MCYIFIHRLSQLAMQSGRSLFLASVCIILRTHPDRSIQSEGCYMSCIVHVRLLSCVHQCSHWCSPKTSKLPTSRKPAQRLWLYPLKIWNHTFWWRMNRINQRWNVWGSSTCSGLLTAKCNPSTPTLLWSFTSEISFCGFANALFGSLVNRFGFRVLLLGFLSWGFLWISRIYCPCSYACGHAAPEWSQPLEPYHCWPLPWPSWCPAWASCSWCRWWEGPHRLAWCPPWPSRSSRETSAFECTMHVIDFVSHIPYIYIYIIYIYVYMCVCVNVYLCALACYASGI